MDFPIPISVKMIIMSHLSDFSEGVLEQKELRRRSEFLKYLLIKYPDLKEEIMVDQVYREFLAKYPKL